ncbi:hypothetical protein ADUPG1_008211, partial [Aduncisulcus paluster]
RFGVPREIISDQGRQYANYLSDHLFDTFGIVHHRTTSDHPEANGRVERVNREVKRHLMGFVSELIEKDEWDSCLPLVQNIINHTPHSAIGCSPSEMLFGGRKSRSVIVDWQNSRETSLSELPEAHKHVDEYVKQLTDNIDAMHRRARFLQKRVYPEADPDLTNGDWIILKRFPPPKKLQMAWEGPFQIIAKTADREYTVRSPLGATRTVHSSDIKKVPGVDESGALDAIAVDLGLRLPREVLKKKGRGRGLQYLVRWYGLPDNKTSWVQKKDIEHSEAFRVFSS